MDLRMCIYVYVYMYKYTVRTCLCTRMKVSLYVCMFVYVGKCIYLYLFFLISLTTFYIMWYAIISLTRGNIILTKFPSLTTESSQNNDFQCGHWCKFSQNVDIPFQKLCTLLIIIVLTHWGRVTHICVDKLTIIGSDNGLSPGRRQAIIWTSAGILLIGP